MVFMIMHALNISAFTSEVGNQNHCTVDYLFVQKY